MDDVFRHGEAYERFMGRWSRLVAPGFLDWLGLPGRLRWADVGCGSGALTSALLQHSAPSSVLGLDPSSGQVAEATRRILDPRASFSVGTAEDLPPGSVDVAVSGLVLNFVPSPPTSLAAMATAASGGVVASYVWDYAEGMQLLRRFWDVAGSLDPAVADLHEGHRFSWSSPEALAALWTGAGLDDVRSTAITVPMVFEDFDDYWLPFLGAQGPAPAYVATLDDASRERLRSELARVLVPDTDGRIRLTARAWAVAGRAS